MLFFYDILKAIVYIYEVHAPLDILICTHIYILGNLHQSHYSLKQVLCADMVNSLLYVQITTAFEQSSIISDHLLFIWYSHSSIIIFLLYICRCAAGLSQVATTKNIVEFKQFLIFPLTYMEDEGTLTYFLGQKHCVTLMEYLSFNGSKLKTKFALLQWNKV